VPIIDVNSEIEKQSFYADLVVVADGCFSNFRTAVLGDRIRAQTSSHFIGVVLGDATLPILKHGTVAPVHGSGPVLMYQISERDTRMLVDIKVLLPKDIKVCPYVYI
jgi:squalene monooxygenase